MPQLQVIIYNNTSLTIIFLFIILFSFINFYVLPRSFCVSYIKNINKNSMLTNYLVNSPLEQFDLFGLVKYDFFFFIIYLNNLFFNIMITLFLFVYIIFLTLKNTMIPKNIYQTLNQYIYHTLMNLLIINATKTSQIYFPFVLNLGCIIFFCNIIGMLPFGFTATSHIIITFFFSFSIFFFINIISLFVYKARFMALFLPNGTPFLIMPFLFLIELISYISRVFSLAIRLFANMMSGHTLLKILNLFLFSSFSFSAVCFFFNIIPIFLLNVIIFMELCIAILQVYVFIILSSLYINDTINVSH